MSVLVTLALAAAVLAAVILAVAAEISEVVADPDFQHSLKQAVIDINEALKLDYGISIEELANVNASNNNTVQNMTLEQVSQTAEPFIMVINDIVITLLLCLYMLSTREPEAEEDLFKEIQVMSMFEKIKFKVTCWLSCPCPTQPYITHALHTLPSTRSKRDAAVSAMTGRLACRCRCTWLRIIPPIRLSCH